MLKFLFWMLVLGNALVFAYHQGYMQAIAPDGREPGRVSRQMNADKLKLVPAPVAAPPAEQAAPAAAAEEPAVQQVAATEPAAAVADAKPIACTEIGNFDADEARRFEARIASLALGNRISQRAAGDGMRHIVFIPAQGSKEGAERKAAELRELGIKDFYVVQDGGDMRWGISLGIFRTEEAARAHLAALNRKGVRSARLGPYAAPSARLAYRVRDLDGATRDELDRIGKDFPQQQIRSCESV